MTTQGIGIIGTGWGARVQVPAFRSAGLEVVALAGSQAEKTRGVAAEHGIPFATADWRELLAHAEVGLVSIVTPPRWHKEMAVAALAAGKHVLCEKPTALDAAEARVMLDAAEARSELFALIDHELRFLPVLREMRRLVGEGAIGAVRFAELRVVNEGRANPRRPWNWWSDAGQGGGALGAIGSHQVDLLRYLLADEAAAAMGSLSTMIAVRPLEPSGELRPVTADDTAFFQLRMRGGSIGLFTVSLVAAREEPNSVTLHGAGGTLGYSAGRLTYIPSGGEPRDLTPPHSVALPQSLSGDFPLATVYLGHALRAALDGDRAALAAASTFADGLRNQEALDAVRRSARAGWVTLAAES